MGSKIKKTKVKISLRDYASFMTRYLRGRLHLVAILSVGLFTNIGLQILNPQILRRFIDLAQEGGERALLVRLALTFIGIAITNQLLNVLVVYITENLGWSATNELRMDLARHMLGLDMSFHTSHTPGEMIERIDGDVMALTNFFSQFLLQVVGNLVLVVGVLLVLLREDWSVTVSLAIFVVITMVVLLRLANVAVSAWEEERQSSANLFGFLEERISGTEDIRSNNAKNYVLDRFYRLTRDLMRKTIRAGLKMNLLLNTTWVLFAIGTAVAYLVSAALFRQGLVTLGAVYMITYYMGMINWPLERITQQMQDLQRAGASLVRILGVQRLVTKIPGEGDFQVPVEKQFAGGPLAVVFEKVHFGYDDAPPAKTEAEVEKPEEAAEIEMVLCDVSFQLSPGRVIGLLGRTGSGKTTITRLLFRLYEPSLGRILFGAPGAAQAGTEKPGGNGRHPAGDTRLVDIRELPLQELRRSVGMVTQNIQLFHASVRDNLTFFDPSISDEKILAAIQDLGLGEWFQSLPNGLDTELESGSGSLSAGEAQLLAFTRIFLRNPGLVILDEATSRLDPATEHLIERAVDKLVRDRTAIIVAHRLGTVQRADDILILEDGMVVEYGERADLAKRPETRFHHLLETGLEEVLA